MLIYRTGHLLLEIRLDMSIHHVTKSNLICDVLASASGLELLSAFYLRCLVTVIRDFFDWFSMKNNNNAQQKKYFYTIS